MTTFGWKRKAGENVSKDISAKFSLESEKDDVLPRIFWVQSFKKKKLTLQKNCKIKSEEFKTSGIKFAETQRFQEAVTEWNKALNLVPDDYKLLEMKAQALLLLNTPFEAVQVAEKAVKINPRWWISFQTLGRSQLGIGDIQMAKRSFSKAVHLNPSIKELWEEDLRWTVTLIERKNKLSNSNEGIEEKSNKTSEIIFDEEGYILNCDDKSKSDSVQCRR